jgi:hypothetical protein
MDVSLHYLFNIVTKRKSLVVGQSDLTERNACLHVGFSIDLPLILKMESVRYFEMSVDLYRITWHYIPEDVTLVSHFVGSACCLLLAGFLISI